MPPQVHDVYRSLLNNGIYAFQPNCKMDVDVIKYSMNCHYGLVRSVYIQSPQVAYMDLCIGNELSLGGISSLESTELIFLIPLLKVVLSTLINWSIKLNQIISTRLQWPSQKTSSYLA